jgi:hypothetical protein
LPLCGVFRPAGQLPKNTLQYEAGPLQVDAGESACATPEAAATGSTAFPDAISKLHFSQ